MDHFLRKVIKMNEDDKPLIFRLSNDGAMLHKDMVDMAVKMAQVGIERAASEMDGVVTMKFEPNEIVFEYRPNPPSPKQPLPGL